MPAPTKTRALELLQAAIDQLQKLRGTRVSSPPFVKWNRTTKVTIDIIFNSDKQHTDEFSEIAYSAPPQQFMVATRTGIKARSVDESPFFEIGLQRAKAVLESMMEEIETHWPDEPVEVEVEDFWSLLHPSIVTHCRSRFEAGYYADCVETGLKFINATVKERVKRKTGNELDGASLMNTAFSPKSPLICLDDLSTENGKNVQQGYMQIFAGAMTGIRNPKAHAIVVLKKNKAIHFLFLVSLLMIKLDEGT